MSSIHLAADLEVAPEAAWSVLEAYSRAQDDIFSIVVKKRMEGNVRVITTPDGHEVREHMVTVDPKNRRVSYTIPEQPPGVTTHFASMEILTRPGGGCTLRWITDYWPEPPAALAPIYEQAFKDLVAAVAKARP